MMTLFCLLFGEAEAFPIEISGEKTLGVLKKFIHAENPNSFRSIDARTLQLWEWNRAEEVNDSELGSQNQLSVRKTLNQVFKNKTPNPEFVHIIIKAPTPGTARPATTPAHESVKYLEDIRRSISEDMRSISEDFRRSSEDIRRAICSFAKIEVYLSSVSRTQYNTILSSFDLGAVNARKIEVLPTENELMMKGFRWGPEEEDSQMLACLDWLRQIIPIPEGKVMLSAAAYRTLLDYSIDNFVLKGTTDIIILPEIYEQCRNFSGGIQIAIELKKSDISEVHHRQAVLQLLTASVRSNYAVAVILTNLSNHWQFIWLSKSGINETSLDPCRALSLFRAILNEETCALDGQCTVRQYIAEKQGMKVTNVSDSPLTQDQFLRELQTKVHPYDLIPKPDVGNMEEFFDEMDEDSVMRYKFTTTMNYLAQIPAWQPSLASVFIKEC